MTESNIWQGDNLQRELTAIVNKQYADADNERYPHSIGKMIRVAAASADGAMSRVLTDAIKQKSFEPLLRAVEEAKERFRHSGWFDEDGFGLGTFGDILADLRRLQERAKDE